MKKKILLTSLLSFTLFSLYSQSHPDWINYTFSHRVTEIALDNDNVWISTQGGLVKYNKYTGGKTFYNRANSNLPDNNLLSLCLDENKCVWVSGKYYGIGKFNGETCQIYNRANSGLPSDIYNAAIKADKKGNIWVASFMHMVKFDGNNWKVWTTGSPASNWPIISDFVIDDNGIVWIYSTDGLGKIENDEYSIVSTIGSGLIAKCGSIIIDNTQNIWIAVETVGLYKYDGLNTTLYANSNSSLPTNNIYSVSLDSKNAIWIGSDIGLIKFSVDNCELYSPEPEDKFLFDIIADINDTIWCGSINGKLLCFDGSKFTDIDISNSPLKSNTVENIITDEDGNTWIGTKKNTVVNANHQLYQKFPQGASAFAIDNKSTLWIAFWEGDTCVLEYKKSHNGTVFNSLNSPFNTNEIKIVSMVFDKNNNLWIATIKSGLYKYDGTSFTHFNTNNSGIPSNYGRPALAIDKDNNLFGGTFDGGLYKFDGANWEVWNKNNSAIPTNNVTDMVIDSNNNIWFACHDESGFEDVFLGGGITCMNGAGNMKTFDILNSGLLSNSVRGLYIDKKHLMWLGCYWKGLMSFDMIDNWDVYNVYNSGLANNVIRECSEDKSGYLWLGHSNAGVSVFNPTGTGTSVSKIIDKNKTFVVAPNPFKHQTILKFNITENNTKITLKVFNINGTLLETKILDQHFNTGYHQIVWEANNYKPGVYLFSLTINKKILNSKFIIVE